MPKRLLLALADVKLSDQAAQEVFVPAGYGVTQVYDAAALRGALRGKSQDILFLGDRISGSDSFELAEGLTSNYPTLPIVLVAKKPSPGGLLRSMQAGFVDYLSLPLDREAALDAAKRGLERKRLWEGWLKKETGRITGPLNRRLSEMETILGQVNDGVLVVDGRNRILMINQALRQAFDLGSGDLLGHPADSLFGNEGLLEALGEKGRAGERIEVQNKSGRIFHVRVTRIPQVGTVASLHDISYLKELDRLKGDFVNTVSHDLRSPLTAILGYVELIERAGKVNPQQAEFIQRVKSSVHTTTNLIDDLLNLGRAEVGAVDERTPVDVKLLIANALASVQPQIQEKGQTLKMGQMGALPLVLGSRTQLNQLVDNLIGNAVKYTPKGGEIRVMLREEQNQLILHVADNGPGIPLEEQPHIFEKFYRASNVGNGVPGTGLGLAIVKTIVDNHHGRIWVDSKPGEGAVFTVVLPVMREEK